jgi:hypothetical protein
MLSQTVTCECGAVYERSEWKSTYRDKDSFNCDHPLTAPAYSERRSTLAKQLGLGRKPKAQAAATPTPAKSPVGKGNEKVEADYPAPSLPPTSESKSDLLDKAASRSMKKRQRRTPFSGCHATI